jgi:hypothetical protein
VRRHRPLAVVIAETQLAAVTGLPRAAIVHMIRNPRQDLVMAADGQAYRVTTVVLAQSDGALRIHVSVDNSDWAAGVVIVRTALLR